MKPACTLGGSLFDFTEVVACLFIFCVFIIALFTFRATANGLRVGDVA